MEWEDDAYVLSARAHGENGAIVDLLTAEHGRYAAHVAGGASRKMKPFLQSGSRVIARYRARVSEQLGSASLEPVGEGPARKMTPFPRGGAGVIARYRAGVPEQRGWGSLEPVGEGPAALFDDAMA